MRRGLLILFVLLASACSKNVESAQGLTIYTGRDKDEVAHVIDLFTQKFPQYKGHVNTITLGAQAALDRLRAEKSILRRDFCGEERFRASSRRPARGYWSRPTQ